MADLERRLIWPNTEFSPPDILLSIGTGCNSTTLVEAANYTRDRFRQPDRLPMRSSLAEAETRHNMFEKFRKSSQTGKVYKLLKHRFENILDTEWIWLDFMSDAARGDEDAKKRYRRINPNLGENPPKLDDVKMLPWLRQRMHKIMKHVDFQKQIGEVARELVAASFYVQLPTPQDFKVSVLGMIFPYYNKTELIREAEIHCKFPLASQEIRDLGDYLKNSTTGNFRPYFIIGEQSSNSEPIKINITQLLIEKMMMNASFEVEPIRIPISSESAITTISLSIVDGEEIPISGLPRALLAKKVVKGNGASSAATSKYQNANPRASAALSPSSNEPGGEKKAWHASRHQSFAGDGASYQSASEPSDTDFPELRQLPREAKLPIRDFLREQISRMKEKGEHIPRKLSLLAEAIEEVEDEDEDDGEGDSEIQSAGGPYGTILHTAAAIGNERLVTLQMNAGVDIFAYDGHFWTALMVATAQGHTSCIKLLSTYEDTRKAKAHSPSSLVKAQPKFSISLGPKSLTVKTDSWSSVLLQKGIQLRADHPIPPYFRIFYYEIEILNSGPLGCVHTSAMKLLIY